MNTLCGEVVSVSKVSPEQINRMYFLMSQYYGGSDRVKFKRDLAEKQWVLLLIDVEGTVQGFTTIMLMEQMIRTKMFRCIFSGDTIINLEFRGQLELMKVWLKFTLGLKEQRGFDELFWFLISKGYRTYKMLPLFFLEYFPRYDFPTDTRIKSIMDAFASSKFSHEYDKESGLITPIDGDYLKDEDGEITLHKLKDEHVRFFVKKNPNFSRGEELVCMALLDLNNLSSFGRRLISR